MDYRQQAIRGLIRSFLVIAVLPTLTSGIYYGLIASDQFLTEARFAILSEGPASTNPLQALGVTIGGGSQQDSVVVHDYLLSRDLLEKLDKELKLRAHFSSKQWDWFSRLDPDASQEDFVKYFNRRVKITIEEANNVITLSVQAYTPAMAQTLAARMVKASEDLVNQMSKQVARESLQFASDDLGRAEALVRSADAELTGFRNTRRTIYPDQETGGLLGIMGQLEGQLATARTELTQARSYMRDDSPSVIALKTRISALESEVETGSNRLTGSQGNNMSEVIERYAQLDLARLLAKDRYTSALRTMESARIEAVRKQRHLVAFVLPSLPQESTRPERIVNTLMVAIASFLAFGILNLLWAAVKDHVGI